MSEFFSNEYVKNQIFFVEKCREIIKSSEFAPIFYVNTYGVKTN